MKKSLFVFLTLLLMVVFGFDSALSAEKVLKLGASVGITGRLAKEGGYVKDGYTLWMEEVNKKGGIKVGNDRYKVEIVFYDDKSDPQTGAKLTEKLITEDKVKFILGPLEAASPWQRVPLPKNTRSSPLPARPMPSISMRGVLNTSSPFFLRPPFTSAPLWISPRN